MLELSTVEQAMDTKCAVLLLQVLFLIAIQSPVSLSRPRQQAECVGSMEPDSLPTESTAHFMASVKEMTVSLLPNWSSTQHEEPTRYVNKTISHFLGPLSCHSSRRHRHHHGNSASSLHEIAACPWRYVINSDTNRRPDVLLEAECLCPHTTIGGQVHFCESVTQSVIVYRKVGCEDGVFVYRKFYEAITVACVAASLPVNYEYAYRPLLVSEI